MLTGKEVYRVPFIKLFGWTSHVIPSWREQYPHLNTYIDELLRFEGTYRGWNIVPINFGIYDYMLLLCSIIMRLTVGKEGKIMGLMPIGLIIYLAFAGVGIYVLYLLIKALRIYIKKNS